MSSTLEDVDGNDNITSDLEEKDSETKLIIKCTEEEVLVNGDRHMDHKNLNGDARDEQDESVIDKATKLSSPLNGIKRDTDQEFKFILAEYEHTKNELSKLQTDYRLSLEREKSLCEKLQDYHGKEDSSVDDLSRVNEDLRKNLDAVLEELKSSKEELKRLEIWKHTVHNLDPIWWVAVVHLYTWTCFMSVVLYTEAILQHFHNHTVQCSMFHVFKLLLIFSCVIYFSNV